MARMARGALALINVDLELASSRAMPAIVAAMEARAFVLHSGRVRGAYRAAFELARDPRSVEGAIKGFVALIAAFDRAALREWRRARVRRFSIGFHAPSRTQRSRVALPAPVVRSIAELDASIELVFYPP